MCVSTLVCCTILIDMCSAAGPALADNATGAPVDNQTDGAKTGETRANYKGLGDVSIDLCTYETLHVMMCMQQ